MKKLCLFRVLSCALIAGTVAVSCEKALSERDLTPGEEGKIINVSINAEIPPLQDAETGTKVTFSEENLVWEGNETMGLMFGNSGSGGANNSSKSLTLSIPKSSEGNYFAGSVAIVEAGGNSFSEDDLLCLSVPGRETAKNYIYYSSSANRIQLSTDQNQVQVHDGVMNGEYFPLYATVNDSLRTAAKQTDGSYIFEGLKLKWGCSVLRFNVYGASLDDDEVVESVKINTPTNKLNRGTLMVQSSEALLYNGDHTYRTVTLQNPAVVGGKTAANGVKLFMSVASRNNAKIESIEVKTNKTTYTKALSEPISLSNDPDNPGKVYQYGLNLDKFASGNAINYSIDGGYNYSTTLPEGPYTSLIVKTGGSAVLSKSDLEAIATSINAQSDPVALDLSQATYESITFPNVFKGTTKGSGGSATGGEPDVAGTQISSIKFPSNVTRIVESAFLACDKLTSVDLTGIKTIGASAFRATALASLTLPAEIDSIGGYAFSYTWDLTELHYNCKLAGQAGSQIFALRNGTGAYDDQPERYKAGNFSNLTAYFGADCNIAPYLFDTNHKLNTVVFEGIPATTGNAWLIRCRFLETIDCRALTTSYTSYNGPNNGQVGVQVTGTKQILVPDRRYVDFYADLWKSLVDSNGYTMVDPYYVPAAIQYSANGTTWADEIPASFTSLFVKGTPLTADDLASIKTAVNAQSAPVSLDLSGTNYEASTFPNVFGGTTKADGGKAGAATIATKGSQISSMVFPLNITSIASAAFRSCDKLTSVDLTGIVTINGSAFANSGLTSVTVPSSVTTCGTYAFGYCPDLETIYWNSPATNNHAVSWRGEGSNSNNNLSKPQTVYFGPGVSLGSGQCFDTNHKLSKVVFLGDPASVGSGWIIRCTGISTFDLSACTKSNGTNSANLGNVGDDVPTGTAKVIIVPDDLKTQFAAATTWKYLVSNKGFVIKGVSEME